MKSNSTPVDARLKLDQLTEDRLAYALGMINGGVIPGGVSIDNHEYVELKNGRFPCQLSETGLNRLEQLNAAGYAADIDRGKVGAQACFVRSAERRSHRESGEYSRG